METNLIQFGAEASAVTKASKFGQTVRLLTAKEFKSARSLTGQEAKRQYNAYLREQGKANTAGLAAAMTSGELLVKGFQKSKTGMRVGFVFASSIRDPKAKSEVEIDRASALKALGLTEQQLLALQGKGK